MKRLKRSLIIKIALIVFVIFWYFFSGGLLTRLLYRLETNELSMLDWSSFPNIIDCNIPHILAFVVLGAVFKWNAVLLAIFLEGIQGFIKGKECSLVDIYLNIAGAITGIMFYWAYKKKFLAGIFKKRKMNFILILTTILSGSLMVIYFLLHKIHRLTYYADMALGEEVSVLRLGYREAMDYLGGSLFIGTACIFTGVGMLLVFLWFLCDKDLF